MTRLPAISLAAVPGLEKEDNPASERYRGKGILRNFRAKLGG